MKKALYILVFLVLHLNIVFAQGFQSPSLRNISGMTPEKREELLKDASPADLNLFENLISQEEPGFLGYHASPQSVVIYQDIIKTFITEIVKIPIREDFQFLRIPADERLNYSSSEEFLREYGLYQKKVITVAQKLIKLAVADNAFRIKELPNTANQPKNQITFKEALKVIGQYTTKQNISIPKYNTALKVQPNKMLQNEVNEINDMTYEIQTKLLSVNMALYQTEGRNGAPLTVLAYRYNFSYSSIYQKLSAELIPFFDKMGVEQKHIAPLFELAQQYMPKDRGMILRIAEKENAAYGLYDYINKHGYISHPYGMPLGDQPPSSFYLTESINYFPELKILMANKFSLNPHSNLSITRYGTLSEQQKTEYQQALKNYINKLPYDIKKVEEYRKELLNIWN